MFGSASQLLAQESNPIIANFPPRSYAAPQYPSSPQNFCIIQDQIGRIFVANANGVLVFDGGAWSMIEATRNLKFFKFAVDPSGRVFSGGEGDLGYFQADETGKMGFHSLKDQLPDSALDFSRITRVEYGSGKTWFLSNKYLFGWEEGGFQVWSSRDKLLRVFVSRGAVFVWSERSLMQLVGGEMVPLKNSEEMPGLELRAVFANEGHTPVQPDLTLVTYENGIFHLTDRKMEALNAGLDTVKVFNAMELPSGQIAVGTSGGGMYILDRVSGQVKSVIGTNAGLQQSQVVFQGLDREGALWLALFSGISRVEYGSALSLMDIRNGLKPLTLSMEYWNGRYMIGTVDGCFVYDPGHSVSGFSGVKRLALDTREVLGLINQGDNLIVVADNGIFLLQKDKEAIRLSQLADITGYSMVKSPGMKLYVVTAQKTVHALYHDQDRWAEQGLSDTLPHLAFTLAQAPDGRLWAAYDGISRIDLSLPPGHPDRIFTLDSSHGFDASLGFVEVRRLQDRIVFGSEKGILRFDEAQNRLVPDPVFPPDFADGSRIAYNLTETRAGDVWVTTTHQTGLLRKQTDGSFVYDSLPIIRAPISDVFSIYEDPEGVVWFGGVEALVRYDPRIPKDYSLPYHSIVRLVTANDDSVLFHGAYADENGFPTARQPESYVHRLPYALNHLKFEYSALFFDYPEKLRYSCLLEGQDAVWSEWSAKTEREYTNLREGDYVFKVRARNVYGTVSEVAEYRFSILPPWYRTTWAYFAYGLLVVLAIWGIVRLRTHRLRVQNRRLEDTVRERTRELAIEKEKSDALLLNILPRETAEELKEHGKALPRRFEQVTVMFTDFKGFTMIAEQLSPEELVQEIHYCFSRFDEIILKHGLEKIKTIGDAYMCAGGLPVPNDTNAVDVVAAALEIRDFMLELRRERVQRGQACFELRLGIHTGPVVAGVVGTAKYQYDIWGDTVNTAARMESSGEVGQVNISEDTYALVKERFVCTPRGKIPAKNKGEIGMYFVEGPV